jgi:hypothetical protein
MDRRRDTPVLRVQFRDHAIRPGQYPDVTSRRYSRPYGRIPGLLFPLLQRGHPFPPSVIENRGTVDSRGNPGDVNARLQKYLPKETGTVRTSDQGPPSPDVGELRLTRGVGVGDGIRQCQSRKT